tara:strand:+ start:61 stop:573 length:513 start_codon:yes stop_codon:yes gene_type:complete
MSLVDPYHDRVFRNGRVYGVNYDEQTMRPTYTDVSPFGGGRMAGSGLDLEPDVVIYMGKAAQGMPQDQGMDVRIAEGMLKAMSRAIEPQLRTMEYREERDGPATPEPIGPYNPDTDKSEVIQLGDGEKLADEGRSYLRRLLRFGEGGDPGRLYREQEMRDRMKLDTDYVA